METENVKTKMSGTRDGVCVLAPDFQRLRNLPFHMVELYFRTFIINPVEGMLKEK